MGPDGLPCFGTCAWDEIPMGQSPEELRIPRHLMSHWATGSPAREVDETFVMNSVTEFPKNLQL